MGPAAAPAARPASSRRRRRLRWAGGIALVAAPLFLVPTSPWLLASAGRGAVSLAVFAVIYAIVSSSLTIPLRFLDLPSGAHAALFGVGAYASGIVMADVGGGFWIGLLAAIVITALVGALVGALALRTTGLGFLIITIALGSLVEMVISNWDSLTGGTEGFYILDEHSPIPGLDIGSDLNMYYVALGFLFVVLASIWWLSRSRFGRRLNAIRDDETLARSVGITTYLQKLLAFTFSAAIIGIAGQLYAMHLKVITPELFAPLAFIPVFLMVVLGGYRTLAGPALGAWFVLFLPNWLEPIGFDDPTKEQLLFGVLLVVLMLALPAGLLGWVQERLRDPDSEPTPEEPVAAAERPRESKPPALGSSAGATAGRAALQIEGLTKRFGALAAVDDVSLSVAPGEIVGIIGPNGSGKTTLLNCVSGFAKPSSGRVVWAGTDLAGRSPERVARRGIVRTFQQPRAFGAYTPREHCQVAQGRRRTVDIEDLLEFTGLGTVKDLPASSLSFGQLRNLGVATALASGLPQVLMLDEPAAGLTGPESSDLRRRLLALRDRGLGLVVVDHDMPFLLPMCDRLVVLDAGAKIAEGAPDDVRTNPRVVAAYLGERFAQGAQAE